MDDFLMNDPVFQDPQLAELLDVYNKLEDSRTKAPSFGAAPAGHPGSSLDDHSFFDLDGTFGVLGAPSSSLMPPAPSLWGMGGPSVGIGAGPGPSHFGHGLGQGLPARKSSMDGHTGLGGGLGLLDDDNLHMGGLNPLGYPPSSSSASASHARLGQPSSHLPGLGMSAQAQGRASLGPSIPGLNPAPTPSLLPRLSGPAISGPMHLHGGSMGDGSLRPQHGAMGAAASAGGCAPAATGYAHAPAVQAPQLPAPAFGLSVGGSACRAAAPAPAPSAERGKPAAKATARGRAARGAASSRSAPKAESVDDSSSQASEAPDEGGQQSRPSRSRASASASASAAGPSSAGASSTPVASDEGAGAGDQGKGKRRFLWTEDLHRRFVAAMFDFGVKTATPKVLFELMQPAHPDMTSDHIKSHLQKFRNNSKAGRDMFLKDFERARKEAQQRADEYLADTGQQPFPVHFSTYPMSMPVGQQGEPPSTAEEAAEDTCECPRCAKFATLIQLGVGLPETEEGVQAAHRAGAGLVNSVQAQQARATAATVAVQAGHAQYQAPVQQVPMALPAPPVPARSEPAVHPPQVPFPTQATVPAQAQAQLQGMQAAGAGASAQAAFPGNTPLAAQLFAMLQQPAAVPLGQAPQQAVVGQQLLAILRLHAAQQAASSGTGAAAGTPAMLSGAGASALQTSADVPQAPAAVPGPGHTGGGSSAASGSASMPAPGGSQQQQQQQLSYADLMRVMKGGWQGKPASVGSGGSGGARPAAEAAGPAAAARNEGYAAISRAMAAQLRVHRTMLHRQEGQLVQYGADHSALSAWPAHGHSNGHGQAGGHAGEESRKPEAGAGSAARKQSIDSDDSRTHASGSVPPGDRSMSSSDSEGPLSVPRLHTVHREGGPQALHALFRRKFGLEDEPQQHEHGRRVAFPVGDKTVALPEEALRPLGLAPGDDAGSAAPKPEDLFGFLREPAST